MKQALSNLFNIAAIPLMTVLVSTLTVYGAMGIDPFTSSNALSNAEARR